MLSEVFSTSVILAMIGGLTINLLNLLELQNVPKERRPDFKDLLYWLPYLVWPILGGIVAFIYNDVTSPLGKLVAFHLGLSTPLILRTMANIIPVQIRKQLPPGA
jgi:hypothetical protein